MPSPTSLAVAALMISTHFFVLLLTAEAHVYDFTNSHSSNSAVITNSQNPFLKEILLGRCYQAPPSAESDDAALCPLIVDSFMSVIDGSLDQDIDPESYNLYWNFANFESSPSNKDTTALFVWPPPSEAVTDAILVSNSDTVQYSLPEATPGAHFIHGLVFCGVDKRTKCPVEFWKRNGQQGAMSAFWQGVYALFSNRMRGQVRMVVLEDDLDAIPDLWKDRVMPFLNSSRITSVEVFATDCQSKGIKQLMDSLHDNRKEDTICNAFQGGPNNFVSQWCSVEEALLLNRNDDDDNDGDKEAATSTSAPTSSSSDTVECRCPSDTMNASIIYEYLFWALLLLVCACTYTYWSVRHYLHLPEYQRIPNVQDNHVNGGGGGGRQSSPCLPKQ